MRCLGIRRAIFRAFWRCMCANRGDACNFCYSGRWSIGAEIKIIARYGGSFENNDLRGANVRRKCGRGKC